MFFFEDVCMPSSDEEISFYEDALELGVLNHKAILAVDMYEQCMYLEEGDSPGNDGVFEKMKRAILAVLDKIDSIIRGFLDGVKSLSSDRLTAEEYMNSSTGQLRLAEDLFAMQKMVDKEYYRLRPIISKISDITDIEAEKVASVCDSITEKLHDNRAFIAREAKGVVKAAAVNALYKNSIDRMSDIQKWEKETAESLRRQGKDEKFNREQEKKIKKAAKERAKAIKKQETAGMSMRMRAVQKATNAMSALTNAYKYIGDAAHKALTAGMKLD